MNTVYRAVGSILVGTLCFVLVGASVTVGMVRWIELSLMVGIPMGLSAGLTALLATYAALEYRERRASGSVSRPVVRRLWTASGAVVAYVLASVVGFVLFFFGNGDDGVWVLLFGLPIVVLSGALVAYVGARVARGSKPRPPAPPQGSR